MKLKPRAASSSCGEETPEIEQNAVEFEAGLAPASAQAASAEKGARKIATRGSVAEARPSFGNGERIAVETQQSAVSDELLQNRPCMSAPPKSGVHVGATRPYVQRGQYLR